MNYDPKKVSLIVDGHFVVGYHDGSFITAEKNEDNVIPHTGALGDVTYSESADNTGMIKVTLTQNSSSLPFLQSLSKQKRQFAAQLIDANTNRFQAGGTQCRVVKTPGREYGSEVNGVEVNIHVADFDAK